MPSLRHTVRRLASALVAGSLDEADAVRARGRQLLVRPERAAWLPPLARKLCMEFAELPRPGWRLIADRILAHGPFLRAWAKRGVRLTDDFPPPEMSPAHGAPRGWNLPAVTTSHELARTLRLHPDDLGWLTAYGQAEHYHHLWRGKPKSDRFRLLEIPKPLLKLAQRRVLRTLLAPIPPHEAALGFRRGCSVRDFVAPHTRQAFVLRMDLEDFFPSITRARVKRLFLTAGFPESVSDLLTRLCTHRVPTTVLGSRPLTPAERDRLAVPHLPQGAPTSPALANLCAFRLDCRLAGLARTCGANYTRYADDLLFSGGTEFARQSQRFEATVGGIALEEGLRLNHRKTRHRRASQRQEAAGLVLNANPNLPRHEFDRLKATLTNCVRHGPASQNREQHDDFRAHLQGKVAWVRFIHPERGARLSALLDRVRWEED